MICDESLHIPLATPQTLSQGLRVWQLGQKSNGIKKV